MFEESYSTIQHKSEGQYKDRGSKFLGIAIPVKNEQQVREHLNAIRSQHPKANHQCYAFRLGPGKDSFRYSDDREPSGSAGKPIYGVLLSNDLTDTLIVVVRYFGGTLLGVPGLINAYRSAASAALEATNVVVITITERYELIFQYETINIIMDLLKRSKAEIYNQNMGEACRINFEIARSAADELITKFNNHHLLSGKIEIKVI